MSSVEADVILGQRYRLTRRIALGGMGSVWEAEDQLLDRRVAVKVLSEGLAEDEQAAERFRREARAAAGLSHPNVAAVLDYGEEDGTQFMVMELLHGETLAERLRNGPLAPDEAARIAAAVAEALDEAHRAGIVHRDVKPGNVMLTARGEVKVMDFGIAAAGYQSRLTDSGVTMGTATYLSPEQAAGGTATPASDVYALGVVLYEMLSGAPPFRGDNPVAVAAAHVQQQPPPLAEAAPGVPPMLVALCERAMSKDPEARPAPAAALARSLVEVMGGMAGTVIAPAPPDADRTRALTPPPGTAVLPAAPATAVLAPAPPASGPPAGPSRPRRDRAGLVVGLAIAALVVGSLAWVVARSMSGSPTVPGQSPPASSASIKVPSVVGLPVDEAESRLRDAGLEPVVKKTAGPDGKVVRVDPGEGTAVQPGSTVTLYVGAAPPEHQDHEGKGHKGKGH